jgi:hypothetical protein
MKILETPKEEQLTNKEDTKICSSYMQELKYD